MTTFWTLFRLIFDTFDHFRHFRPFSALFGIFGVIGREGAWNQRDPQRFRMSENGKITVFRGPKCGPQWCVKKCKKWSLHKTPIQSPGVMQKNCISRGQKKMPKMTLFRETVKNTEFSTFSTFFRQPRGLSFLDRVLVGFLEKMTKMWWINGVFD